MYIWRMGLRRTKSTIISWHGSYVFMENYRKLCFNNTLYPALSVFLIKKVFGKMSHLMTKPTKWLRPAKTQISLGICPVWSESSLGAQWVAKGPRFLHADSEDWSDWADAQADPSLRWEYTHFVGFVMLWLKLSVMNLILKIMNSLDFNRPPPTGAWRNGWVPDAFVTELPEAWWEKGLMT